MVVDVKLSRQPGQPFGFRLIGGRDFEIPLTVSRVVDGSIAQNAGMLEGDVVVRINDTPTIEMTHEDAHEALVAAGNDFVLGVLRATNVLAEGEVESTEQQGAFTEENNIKLQQERIDKIIPDKPVTDEEIAELLSGEAEVLRDGVLGVNFNRMMPKAGVFKRSEVFQALNDEQLKTKKEEPAEKTHWTTFLQKPKRPPPQPRHQQVITNTYKPVIVKQPKPRCAPDYRVTPSPEPIQVQQVQETVVEERKEEKEENVQVQEQISTTTETHSESTFVATSTVTTTTTESLTFEELAADATGEEINEDLVADEIKSQSDEVSVVSSAFAEQLSSVQSQLLALSHLPKTIQSTLDEITKQLQSLIPTITTKAKEEKSNEPENNPIEDDDEENVMTNEETVKQTDQIDITSAVESTIESTVTTTTTTTVNIDNQEAEMEHHPNNDEIEEYEESQRKFRELWEKKREKQEEQQQPIDAKTELTAELKQKVTEDRTIKQKKAKNFRGLQPQERPIILPGGRKWKNPKDAMNDEMIAEIISSQAELVLGTTLGVNFLKYQKPEKDLSFLKNSETYRAIHHMTPHENGIEKRPAMVASEEDILKCSSPNPLSQTTS
ncbi:hypothetical protein PVAND_010787 [Polypedilum vanderplanki]|uniref:PDZ domain-containing protein n=1 Tax=Polypedilum vanderplanki TaxID=319348 RepID=A0A9J6CIE0_POLVA|nr:hypothetical protein PVAND_010787 [Polypedilum vanderplanki]